MIRFLVTCAALAVSTATIGPAVASCVPAREFKTISPLTTGGDSRISTHQAYSDFSANFTGYPGYPVPSISANALGFFWSQGAGTLVQGLGNDCGSPGGWCGSPFTDAGTQDWWIAYPLTDDQRSYIGGDYNTWAGVPDGCIDFNGSDPLSVDPDQCMQVLLADAPDGAFRGVQPEAEGYFAFLSAPADSVGFYLLHSAAFDEGGPNAEIRMAPVPAAALLDSGDPTDIIPGGIRVDFSLDRPSASCGAGPYPQCMNGLYEACESVNPTNPPPPPEAIKGYKVYYRELPPGSPSPADRSTATWVNTETVFDFGAPQSLDITCTTGNRIFLCSTLVFDAGDLGDFETPYCSADFPGFLDCGCNSRNDCNDGMICTADVCNTGVCEFPPDEGLCDDRVACTDDTCSEVSGCSHVPDTASCAFCNAGICDVEAGCIPGTPPCPEACDEQNDVCVGSGEPAGNVGGLTVEWSELTPGDLTLRWDPPCNGEDAAVYRGEIPRYYSHERLACNVGDGHTEEITPTAGSDYYLIVPQSVADPVSNSREGSYGKRSNGDERPPGSTICDPQEVVSCP